MEVSYIKIEIAADDLPKLTFKVPTRGFADACQAGIYLLNILLETTKPKKDEEEE